MKTSCKDCLYNQEEVNTQVGCGMGRLNRYLEIGLVTEAYDEEKEFCVIDRICNAKVNKENPNVAHWLDPLIRREALRIRADLVIPVDKHPLYEVQKTIENSEGQFERIIVVNSNVGKNPEYHFQLNKMVQEKSKKPYRIEAIVEYKSIGDSIDILINLKGRVKSPYYAVVLPGSSFAPDYMQKVDYFANEQLEEFVCIEGDEGPYNLSLFTTTSHRLLDGNVGEPLKDKIRELCKEQSLTLLRKMEEIYL